jgi:hypothetical protein
MQPKKKAAPIKRRRPVVIAPPAPVVSEPVQTHDEACPYNSWIHPGWAFLAGYILAAFTIGATFAITAWR